MRWLGWEMGIESKELLICNDLSGVELSWIPSSSTHFCSYCPANAHYCFRVTDKDEAAGAADAGPAVKDTGVSQRGVMAVTAGSPEAT